MKRYTWNYSSVLQILNELASNPEGKFYKKSGIVTQFVHFTREGCHVESMPICTLSGIAMKGSAFHRSPLQGLYIPPAESWS